jgi:uncharacterized protein DUF4397
MGWISRFLIVGMAVLVATASILTTSGCSSDGHAFIRFVHASPDAPNVDILIDGNSVATNIAYAASTNYIQVHDGSRHIQVKATGTTTTLIDVNKNLNKNTYYTGLAVGKVSDSTLTGLLVTDDHSAPPSGQVKLRAIQASPTAGAVDIFVEAPGTGVIGQTPTVANVAFQAATAFLSEAAGSYEVYVTTTGTTTVVFDSGSVAFTDGQVRTAVLLDAPGGGSPIAATVLKDLN